MYRPSDDTTTNPMMASAVEEPSASDVGEVSQGDVDAGLARASDSRDYFQRREAEIAAADLARRMAEVEDDQSLARRLHQREAELLASNAVSVNDDLLAQKLQAAEGHAAARRLSATVKSRRESIEADDLELARRLQQELLAQDSASLGDESLAKRLQQDDDDAAFAKRLQDQEEGPATSGSETDEQLARRLQVEEQRGASPPPPPVASPAPAPAVAYLPQQPPPPYIPIATATHIIEDGADATGDWSVS